LSPLLTLRTLSALNPSAASVASSAFTGTPHAVAAPPDCVLRAWKKPEERLLAFPNPPAPTPSSPDGRALSVEIATHEWWEAACAQRDTIRQEQRRASAVRQIRRNYCCVGSYVPAEGAADGSVRHPWCDFSAPAVSGYARSHSTSAVSLQNA
jgi:hypothetical protein